jgi:hypothetical protein
MNRIRPAWLAAIMHGVGHLGHAADHPSRGLKPAATAAFLPQGLIKSLQFFAAAIAVVGVREVLSPAARTLLRRGFSLN